ncbi:MAG TPA: glycosyltransferase [Pyrinomonadaceae bacterium]|jgi:glycosyltransferase involved in cell wall biosynthesis
MRQSHGKAIFLSYEGFEQSYLETLYLPILDSIKRPPIDFTVVQFIPKNHPQKALDAAAAERLGIPVHFLNYRNSPPVFSTIYLILNGILKVGLLARREKTDFIHARTWVPGLIALGAKIFRPRLKFIFDTDGFVPEFRVESGLLKNQGLMFKTLKKIEKLLIKKSDLILVRTNNARKILSNWYGDEAGSKIFVTPNGKDENFYRAFSAAENRKVRQKYNLSDEAILVLYVGTLVENVLPGKMFRLFSDVKKLEPNSFFLILSGSNFERLGELAQTEGLTEADYMVERVFPAEIPALISAADVGISFRAPTLSNQGVSPLKVCEYLLCGTPAIVNSGAGDLEPLFEENKELGFLLKEMSDKEISQAAEWIVRIAKPSRERLRETARQGGIKEFGLSNIKKLYENVYSKLIKREAEEN